MHNLQELVRYQLDSFTIKTVIIPILRWKGTFDDLQVSDHIFSIWIPLPETIESLILHVSLTIPKAGLSLGNLTSYMHEPSTVSEE